MAEGTACGVHPAATGSNRLWVTSLVIAAVAAMLVPSLARGTPMQRMSAATFAHLVGSGATTLKRYRIDGDVHFATQVSRRFVCRDCRIDGDVLAPGVRFEAKVDLSGTIVTGKVDFTRSTFAHGIVATGATFGGLADFRGSRIHGPMEMEGATFGGPALFSAPDDGRPFQGDVDFSLATFRQRASFEGAAFGGASTFALARFEGDAIFASGTTSGPISFARTAFAGPADFSERVFERRASFAAASFGATTDFSQAEFDAPVTFWRSRFDDGASFVNAMFLSGRRASEFASFESASVNGSLDLDLAVFDRGISFAQSVISGALSLKDPKLDVPSGINLSEITTGSLQMSVPDVLHSVIDGPARDRERVLDVLETSAKRDGDLGLANDAHYARHELRSRHQVWPVRVLDGLFYRAAAGYFVRPLNPLVILLALAALMAVRRGFGVEALGDSRRLRIRGTLLVLRRVPTAFVDTLATIPPRRGETSPSTPRGEVFVYRVLLACVLIGFANSNPTLRQMLDAVL